MITAAPKLLSSDWSDIRKIIRESSSFLITTHVQADPDALGSEKALAEGLRSVGKTVTILNPTPVSKNFTFIDPEEEIQSFPDDGGSLGHYTFDAVFVLDISRWERLGTLSERIRQSDRPKIVIDHHPYTGGYGDYHIINVEACASAELVYDLMEYCKIPLNKKMAEALYTAILSDTGVFSFSNTTARAHKIAHELLNYGVASRLIFEHLYQNQTPDRLRFLGHVLGTLEFDCDGKLAWMTIPYKMLMENGMEPDDIEGFADMPRNSRGVILSMLFVEVQPGDVKISLRAKGNFNANQLAGRFGGGGHNHASGIRMTAPLPEVQKAVLGEARKALQPFIESVAP